MAIASPLSQTRQAIVEEFHKKYDFSENETLEYDNLIGIADFITKALNDYTESIVRMVERMGKEPLDFFENYSSKHPNKTIMDAAVFYYNQALDDIINKLEPKHETKNK